MHEHSAQLANNRKGLTISLLITAGIMVLEFVGGLVTNSLALLSDAGHMLSDTSSLVLSLVATWVAAKPPNPRKSYGFYRFEILAALFNGATLFIIAGYIIWEAYGRFFKPPTVSSGIMLGVAALGLLANIISAFNLKRVSDTEDNINVKSAYLHIIGDALGSVGAITAGALMLTFSWYVADPIISVLVSLLILKSAWGILNEAIHILMEGTPRTVDLGEIRASLLTIDGVRDVHDLHIWTITSGLDSLTCHLLVEEDSDQQAITQKALDICEERYIIKHATIQVETSQLQHSDTQI